MMHCFVGQITDGRSAWAEFYQGVTGAFEANESALPAIGLVVVVGRVLLLNYRLAVWLARKWSRRSGARGGER